MYIEVEIRVLPEEIEQMPVLKKAISLKAGIPVTRIVHIDIIRKAIDARRKPVTFMLKVGVHVDELHSPQKTFTPQYRDVSDREKVIVVGAGPAGLFAGLRLIERGFCPVILERGKCVEERKKDLKKLYATGEVDENSNFGYGEGGAGTFSDGKLYTRSKKRGDIQRILEILVHHGADKTILVDAHPHLGTDKLPSIIAEIRKTILLYGGKVYFNHKVDGLILRENKILGVMANGKEFTGQSVIMATGHSARDIYRLLYSNSVLLEPKEFAVGLRIEHPQHLIDCIQYHDRAGRGKYLPPAEYNFVTNIDGRGVYTFCMCPGGLIVPAATSNGQQVVNGMSSSARNTPWANSAVVTTVGEEELHQMNFRGVFAGLEFQEKIEHLGWQHGGGSLKAPAQRVTDFISGKYSAILPTTSYKPGVNSSVFKEWLPELIYKRLSSGIEQFGRKARGYVTREASLLGVESRTSSPIRIPRLAESCMHIQVEGLFPCGEGAGYAGGIVSAAMDGEKCAEAIFKK